MDDQETGEVSNKKYQNLNGHADLLVYIKYSYSIFFYLNIKIDCCKHVVFRAEILLNIQYNQITYMHVLHIHSAAACFGVVTLSYSTVTKY
jgi:hypothetical protein